MKKQLVGLLAGLALGAGGMAVVTPEIEAPTPGTMTWETQTPWEANATTTPQ